MDVVDEANRLNDYHMDMGVKMAKVSLTGAGATHCIECEIEIPEARRKACPSAERCIACQTLFEQGKF